jgi:hypothetical protein
VTVDEIVTAVNAALQGCPMEPAVTLADLQAEIFTPRCAIPQCHDGSSATGDLVLEDGLAYEDLVNVVPAATLAAQAGRLRVDPGRPENSFLLIKLINPPPGTGSPMPLEGVPLSADDIEAVRAWILQGALP